jgi:hypothetical protein
LEVQNKQAKLSIATTQNKAERAQIFFVVVVLKDTHTGLFGQQWLKGHYFNTLNDF